jgi:GAF domain-containing protein
MSSNKKIRNRLNELFTDLQQTEREDTTAEAVKSKPTLGKAAEPVIFARAEQELAPVSEQLAPGITITEAGSGNTISSVMTIPFQTASNWNALHLETDQDHEWQEEEQSLVRQVADQLELALQNAHLFQQTERQNRDLAILNEMGRELATQLNVSQIIETLVKYASELMDTSSFFTSTYDEEAKLLNFPFVKVDGVRIEFPSRKIGQGLTDYVLQTRKPLLLNGDVSKQMQELGIEFISLGNSKPALSWLGVPLIVGDKTLGAIVAQSVTTPYLYAEREQDLLTTIASQVAIALQNARLFQQTEQQNAELATLNAMAGELSSSLNVDEITAVLYKYVGRLMDATNFYVALYQKEANLITFPTAYFDGKQANLDPTPVGNGLTAWIIKNNQVLSLPDRVNERVKSLGIDIIQVADDDRAECWLGVPISLGQNVLGIISVQSTTTPRLYTERHRDLLNATASQAAIAIQNARLFQETQQRAAELAGLNEVLRAASSEIDLQKVLEAAYEKLQAFVTMDTFTLALYNAEDHTLDYQITAEGGIKYPREEKPSKVNENTPFGQVIKTKEATLKLRTAEELATLKRPVGRMGEQSRLAASLIYVPLTLQKEIIGVMSIQSYQLNAYNHETVRLMETVANQLAVSLQNAQLYENTQKSLKDLELINRLTSAVSSSLDIQSSLQVIAEELNKAFEIGHVGIALLDADQSHLILTADAPLPASGNGDIGLRIPTKESTATLQVLTTKKPVFVPDVVHNPLTQNIADLMAQRGTKNLMIFPLISGNEVIGTVGFDTFSLEKTFSEAEVRLVETVLYQVAASIRNAQLFSAAQARARREKILREITDRVRATTDPDTIIRTAVRELGQALNLTAFVQLGKKEKLDPQKTQPEESTGKNNPPSERKKPSKGGK